jgi:hypothetical protein
MKFHYLFLSVFFIYFSCNKDENATVTESQEEVREPVVANFEIKGVSYVATRNPIDITNITPLEKINCNWIAQIPFGFSKVNDPIVRFDTINSWWGETDLGITVTNELVKSKGIKTILKPQIYIGGFFTGNYTLSSESDWLIWESQYRNYIMHYAKLAETLKIEMFCVGTELRMTIKERPAFWNKLIDEVRTVYNGKLIYAANWDEFQETPFWDKLDYIGVNGYFPLSNSVTPNVSEIVKNWEPHINQIEKLKNTFNKDVIFTEIGYKSVDQTVFEPWNPTSKNVNMKAQTNAYQGFFEAFSNRSWFKGAFLWKWYPKHETSGGEGNTDYTPQNKPVETLIKKCF